MATQKKKKLLSPIHHLLLILSLLAVSSSAIPTKNLQDAAAKLFSSGYISLSLTLEFGSESIIPPVNSLTIFAPPDSAFSGSGQPSLRLLRFHFSPLHLSPHSLGALPPGTKIPTLSANHSLTVTSSPSDSVGISLNGVSVNGSEMYDDGSLAIFEIEEFLDPNFEASAPGTPSSNLGCSARAAAEDDGVLHSFEDATEVLRRKGYSVMASFLDLQLAAEFKNQTMLTIFAPPDEAMMGSIGNLTEFRSIFLRHIVPCMISWNDAVDLDNGVLLPTHLPGFMLIVTKSGRKLELNGVQVVPGEMFNNSWLVIHGLKGSFLSQERPKAPPRGDSSGVGRNSQKIAAMEFEVMKILIAFSFIFLSMVH